MKPDINPKMLNEITDMDDVLYALENADIDELEQIENEGYFDFPYMSFYANTEYLRKYTITVYMDMVRNWDTYFKFRKTMARLEGER